MSAEEKMSSLLEKYSQFATDEIVNALTDHYIRTDFQYSFDEISDSSSVKPLLFKLIHRMASLEADSFLIKQCLATDQRYVFASPLSTADPAQVIDQLLPLAAPPSASFLKSRWVDLGPEIIGNGWYPAETLPEGYWRWSGPDAVSTLLLPTVGSGRTRLSFEMIMLEPNSACRTSFSINGHAASNVEVTSVESRRFAVSMEADIAERRAPSFLSLRIEVPETVSPAMVDGSNDLRLLGIGLSRIRLELVEPQTDSEA